MPKKYFVLLILPLALLVFYLTKNKEDEVHYHAGFQVYKDGVLQNYNNLEFMKVNPCGAEISHGPSKEEEQLEKAHLHDLIGDVVHVHREGATWGDLFKNIKVELNINKAFVNGTEVNDLLSRVINPYESIVIFEGPQENIDQKLAQAVTEEHIKETEKRSEDCGKK